MSCINVEVENDVESRLDIKCTIKVLFGAAASRKHCAIVLGLTDELVTQAILSSLDEEVSTLNLGKICVFFLSIIQPITGTFAPDFRGGRTAAKVQMRGRMVHVYVCSMKHVFVTGVPGSGKTTLVRNVVERLRTDGYKLLGFYTEEVRDESSRDRIGFDVVSLEGARGPLARVSSTKTTSMVGKYNVTIESFERIAFPTMDVTHQDVDIFVVDEVGKMELFSPAFTSRVDELFSSGKLILGTIPTPSYGRTIPYVHQIQNRSDVSIQRITRTTREAALDETLNALRSQLNPPTPLKALPRRSSRLANLK